MIDQLAISHHTIAQMLRRSLMTQPYALATVTSGSMRPLFEVGDQIGLTAVPVSQLQVGDIITIETGAELLTHRLYIITPTHVITRGDRVVSFDAPVPHEQILGLVVMRRRQDQILDLRRGRGRKMNQELHALAAHEAQHFSRRYWQWRPLRSILHHCYTILAQQFLRRARLVK